MSSVRWVRVVLFVILVAGSWRGQSWAVERDVLNAALETITAADLQRHVNVLADDTFEGRAAGSRGGRAAGGYLATQFERAELRGQGDAAGYFQTFGAYRNLLGALEGSDPELKQQFILIGAHYDHVGYGTSRNSYGPTGYIHNGADDNASGTAALLELVDAFAKLPVAPKRSILFALWDGEEGGLLGSKHWVANPTVPRDRVAFAFNADMLGRLRNNKVEVYGSRTGRGLRQLVSRHNRDAGLDLDFTWELSANSDHFSFVTANIPVLMLFTGLHEDYHRPSDDAEKVNAAGMQQLARLLFLLAHELADSPRVTEFRSAARGETPFARQQFERPLPPPAPRFGVTWERRGEPADSIVLMQVDRGSAADVAGLRVGDRILQFADRPIADDDRFRIDVLAAREPVALQVQRANQPEPTTVKVRLNGDPVRIGISWREDQAEPGTLLVTQVAFGSAAQQAGLREHDRIYEIAGRTFRNDEEFRQLATTLPAPLELLIERRGRLQTIVLPVPPAPPGSE